MSDFLGTGWQFPVMTEPMDAAPDLQKRFVMAANEDSIRQSIWIILSTAKGERVMRPEFGCDIHELAFAPNNAATRGLAEYYVDEALRLWEPRIELIGVKATIAGTQGEELHVDIEYRVRSTDSRFNLVYPFYLERRF